MGASNSESSNQEYYKLKENKDDKSKNFGRLMFFKQGKVNGAWASTDEFNKIDGYVKKLEVKSYEYQGKPKESLNIQMEDSNGVTMFVQVGLTSSPATNFLNTLAGTENLGLITIETGQPKEYQGKSYPTMYVKNNGQKTNWKYNTADDTFKLIPKVESKTDEDGNVIKKGVKANTDFWKKVIEDINKKLSKSNEDVLVNKEQKGGKVYLEESLDPDASNLPF